MGYFCIGRYIYMGRYSSEWNTAINKRQQLSKQCYTHPRYHSSNEVEVSPLQLDLQLACSIEKQTRNLSTAIYSLLPSGKICGNLVATAPVRNPQEIVAYS